jgi:hypothetical protein
VYFFVAIVLQHGVGLCELVIVDEEHSQPVLVVRHLLQVVVRQDHLVFEHVALGSFDQRLMEFVVEAEAGGEVRDGLLEVALHSEDESPDVEVLRHIILRLLNSFLDVLQSLSVH